MWSIISIYDKVYGRAIVDAQIREKYGNWIYPITQEWFGKRKILGSAYGK